MAYEKIKIIEMGVTKNFDWWSGLPISISSQALDDIVRLGNEKPVHCRYTHDNGDMLSGYIGRYINFQRIEDAVYADFHPSEAVRKGGGQDASKLTQIELMLQEEQEMLGCSVVIWQDGKVQEEVYSVTGVLDFVAADFVGIPAATTSLFAQGAEQRKSDNEINNLNRKQMSLFSRFSAIFNQKAQFAAVQVTVEDGSQLTIEQTGEEIAVGDEVKDSEGNPAADGDYVLIEGDEKVKLTVVDGKISQVEKIEVEIEVEQAPASTPPSEDFSAKFAEANERAERLQKELDELKAKQFSQAPVIPAGSSSHSTELSEEKKAEIRNKFKW